MSVENNAFHAAKVIILLFTTKPYAIFYSPAIILNGGIELLWQQRWESRQIAKQIRAKLPNLNSGLIDLQEVKPFIVFWRFFAISIYFLI